MIAISIKSLFLNLKRGVKLTVTRVSHLPHVQLERGAVAADATQQHSALLEQRVQRKPAQHALRAENAPWG
jgi:hypothetical protein